MKQMIFAFIIIIVMGIAWLFYLQHSEDKFKESLPKAPISPSVSDTEESKPLETPQTLEVLSDEELAELSIADMNSEESKESLSEVEAYTQKLYEDMTSELIETPIELTDTNNMTDSELSKPWLKPISEMTDIEIRAEVNRRRQALINTFGDTPEVALINKYTTVESLRDGRVTLDPEDGLPYIRAISVLWSGGRNAEIVKDIEALQRNGWHLDNRAEFRSLPGIE